MEHPKSTPPAAQCRHQQRHAEKPQHLTADTSLSHERNAGKYEVLLLLKPWEEKKELWRQGSPVMDGEGILALQNWKVKAQKARSKMGWRPSHRCPPCRGKALGDSSEGQSTHRSTGLFSPVH